MFSPGMFQSGKKEYPPFDDFERRVIGRGLLAAAATACLVSLVAVPLLLGPRLGLPAWTADVGSVIAIAGGLATLATPLYYAQTQQRPLPPPEA